MEISSLIQGHLEFLDKEKNRLFERERFVLLFKKLEERISQIGRLLIRKRSVRKDVALNKEKISFF